METLFQSWLRFGFLLQQGAKHVRKPWYVKFDKLNSQLKSGSSFIFVLYLNATSFWLIQRHIVEDQSKILSQIKFVISLRKSLSTLSNILQQTQISRVLVSRKISLLFRQRSVTVLVEESFLPSVSPPCLTRPQIMTLSPRPLPLRSCGHEKTFFTGRSIVGSVYKTLARFLVIIVDRVESHCRLCTNPGLCAYWD